MPTVNNLKAIPYNSIKDKPAFCTPGKIGDLSNKNCGKALYQMIYMYLQVNEAFVKMANRIATIHKDGDEAKQKEMFSLLDNNQELLDEVMKHLNDPQNPVQQQVPSENPPST